MPRSGRVRGGTVQQPSTGPASTVLAQGVGLVHRRQESNLTRLVLETDRVPEAPICLVGLARMLVADPTCVPTRPQNVA